MKLEQSFEVTAPLQRVWAALIDVEHVAPCLPGAAVTGRNDDGSYNGTFKVKIGPTSAAYSGKLFMEKIDEDAHTATMNASGTDKRGQGGAKATIVSTVSEGQAGATTVEVVTEYHITGRLARFGRGGMIEEISNRLLGQFATSLQASLAGGGADPPAEAEAEAGPAEASPEAADPAPYTRAIGGPPPAGAAGPALSGAGPAPPPVESEPVKGLSLMASVLVNQAKRNPAPIAALVIGFLVALRVLRRR
ncbi:MAG: SRPBCC family protein [Actinomycetota bacterium]|nr:SRPBCC family protein [Actinomycetota bacterium]